VNQLTGVALEVRASATSVASVEEARVALGQMADLDAVVDVANRANAAAAYFARAKDAADLAVRATEIRIWAERRAGELLDPEISPAESARQVGTNPVTIKRWQCFAAAASSHLEQAIAETLVRTGDLTITGAQRRLIETRLTKVERGIYRNHVGSLIIRWRARGVSRQQNLGPMTVDRARRQLLTVTGKIKPDPEKLPSPSERVEMHLATAYESVRWALTQMELAREVGLRPEAVRASADDAYSGLYKAEDALGHALRLTG
jgi:hypothetical protein